jgi:hypothetical protein
MDARSVAENQGGPMGEASAMLAEMTAKKPEGIMATGKPEGIMATISALATATDDEKTAILFPDGNRGVPVVQQTYETPQMTGLEEFQQSQPISKEVSDQMRVLDMAKRGASISEMSKASGIGLLELTNILAGSASLLVTEGAALAGDVASLITGGGDVSKALSRTSQDLRDFGRNAYLPESATDVNNIDQSAGILNFAPRLIDTSGPTPVELESERLAQIEMDSLRNISDGMVAGDEALFAEGAPVESLGGNFPDSIIEARITESPETPRFSSAGDGPQSVSSPQMTNEELGFDGLVDEMAVESARRAPSLLGYDTSTGGAPLTMDEVSESVLTEREQAAAAGLTNTQEQGDRFPQEDARIAAQEAALSEIRTRRLSDQEREQMALGTNTGTGLTIEDAADAQPSTSMPPSLGDTRPQARPNRTDADADADANKKVGDLSIEIDKDPGNAGSVVSTSMLNNSGVDTSNMGIKERTVAMKKMLTDLMGQTDADEKEEFWMNMAMVGFGIASGDSPDAMKNIADGLLAGTAQISKGTSDKKARDDKFTLTAYGEVLADERAREKFGRDQVLAGIRANGESSFSTPDRMYKSTYDALLGSYKRAIEDGDMTDAEAVSKAAQIASEAYPNSQFSKPDPAVTSLIKTQRKLGKSEAEIKKMMIEANQNPALYGIS